MNETLRVLEDYKSLDVECAAMGLRLCRGIRERYPDWKYLADGDGGDENLKDYPIEENPELTIRSVVDNLMLYQEGWGVGRIKHSLTYTGGLSRSYVRTYAPARRYSFEGFSPYTRPNVIEVAEGIPFAALTRYDVPTLYALKGEIVRRGIKAVTGIDMPVFPKRRFQHGAVPERHAPRRARRRRKHLPPRVPRDAATCHVIQPVSLRMRSIRVEPMPVDATPRARDRFVVERRGPREARDPWRHQGVIVEDERAEDGAIARVATVFLTGRECPWRCVMCDLWRYTIEEDTPVGAIPAQIAAARQASASAEAVSVMKLYNAGSFFDPRAVPESDYDDIAAQLAGLERVIVESHPALIGARVDRFLDALARQCARGGRGDAPRSEVPPRLEVAMGLETAHPEALERLHKRVTLERFAQAAAELRRRDVALRVFLLISPPFIPADEQDAWLLRSDRLRVRMRRVGGVARADAAGERRAGSAAGRGTVSAADARGHRAQLRGRARARRGRGRDIRRSLGTRTLRGCRLTRPIWLGFAARRERLRLMNLEQRVLPSVEIMS